MKKIQKNNLVNYFQLGKFSFFIGLFLLPSAISLSIIFLLFSLIISYVNDFKKIFNDKLNLIFLISCIFLIISGLVNFFDKSSINNISNNSSLTFIGLLNWIPLIFAFFGFQKYLLNNKDREICIYLLIFGYIPVIFSCFGQLLFNWFGPMKTLYGLIIWYQRPIEEITGVTGLFNNANYLAAWLNIIWPFSLAFILFDNNNKVKLIFKLLLIFSVSLLIILTASRAGWLCLLIPILFIHGSRIKLWVYSFFTLLSIFVINLIFPIFGVRFQAFLQQVIPKGIWINFTEKGYESLDISRLGIWEYAYKFISDAPLFGNGSKSFSYLFLNETGFWKGHAHNLPLELMINYGIPAALMILLPTLYLTYKAYSKLFLNNLNLSKFKILDQAWIISLILLILMHLVDIQYFDGRISIVGWVLLAGTRNIVLHNEIIDNEKISKI